MNIYHYPLSLKKNNNWIIASLVFLLGVLIRHYFNSIHSRTGTPNWTWLVSALIFIVIMWLSTAPLFTETSEEAAARPFSPTEQVFASAAGFDEAERIVLGRCSMCHSREPFWDGVRWAPKGVHLETKADIARAARQIYLQAGVSVAMPPANLTFITDEERESLIKWYRAGAAELPLRLAMGQ